VRNIRRLICETIMSSCRRSPIRIGNNVIDVEIADTQPLRSLGLMYRSFLPSNEGMLFSFPDEKNHSFWMRNTYIPLSIAFINRGGEIVDIADMDPLEERNVKSHAPSCYALEMNKGWFDNNNISAGDIVRDLPPIPFA
tara:strand:+ start:319 stop:735 length:417 start_codon:yes stop_codon:yes gene_type:complete